VVDDPRIKRAAAGDRRALEELLRELLPRVRNLVRYLVRGDYDVDDISQKVLIAIARNLGSFRGEGKLTSWTDRITARETFAHLAKERGRSREQDRAAQPELYAVGESPERYVLRRELAKQLDELPFDQRHAVVLHHVLGLSIPELAVELAIPEETARSRIRLGMKKLRERFAREEAV
jgi:RNA polymerase sigma-70 factor, ECF subfamily